jgi:hypothetical protein
MGYTATGSKIPLTLRGHSEAGGTADDLLFYRCKYPRFYLAGAIPDNEQSVIDPILQESFSISIITQIELPG